MLSKVSAALFLSLISVSVLATPAVNSNSPTTPVPTPAKVSEKKFVLVGISGFQTGRPEGQENNILSNQLCSSCQMSGVWSLLNIGNPKIAQRAFLTHYSKDSEINNVLKLFVDRKTGKCKKDLGLVVMANSWGAAVGNSLAASFKQTCGSLPDLFIMIDGISKPLTFSYTSPVVAKKCLNVYQTVDVVHGAPIANCVNHDVSSKVQNATGLAKAHIYTEWHGAQEGNIAIEKLLSLSK